MNVTPNYGKELEVFDSLKEDGYEFVEQNAHTGEVNVEGSLDKLTKSLQKLDGKFQKATIYNKRSNVRGNR